MDKFSPKSSAVPLPPAARLLVVDDDPGSRSLLVEYLHREGFRITQASNGMEALLLLADQEFDLVITDLEMPEIDGYGVLEQMRKNKTLRHIPVLIVSGWNEIENVVRGIEMGAADHLSKPFNRMILLSRVHACLERKRWHDQEKHYLEQISLERDRSERLLLNILPRRLAERLKAGETTIADYHPDVTVLFADIVGFTNLSQVVSAAELVRLLNEIFSAFDLLATRYGLEKIKTIGDCYMIVGGLPEPREDHALAIARMALDMRAEIARFNAEYHMALLMRMGINTGPVVAGVIGRNKFIYDIWGDTVNTASRMESHSLPGEIQVTEATQERLKEHFHLERRPPRIIKGKGRMITYMLKGLID
ncbi:MAG TPA: adenylate/guanylate cyclase domain-containing protein [Roseimicrobium sp.]|nr:adenylate/guanylate cyclase domain-containing protein [Roseimicrobium sp.]